MSKMSNSQSAANHLAAEQLNSFAIHLLRSLRPVDQRAGLTAARLSTLSVLVYAGPQTLSALARIEEVRRPTMSGIVDGLEEAGLARRIPHPTSARLILIEATGAGQRIMETARQARLQAIAESLARLELWAREAIIAAAPHLQNLVEGLRSNGLP
jgi:DNA-binding MarR family transcriptional regulator